MLNRVNSLLAGSLIAALTVIFVQAISPYGAHQHGEPQRSQNAHNQQGVSDQSAPLKSGVQIECDPNCATKEPEDHQNENWAARFVRKSLDDPLASATVVLALATLFMAFYTATVARATKAAAGHIPIVEGAYVYITLVEDINETTSTVLDENNSRQVVNFNLKIGLKNFGKTSAFIEKFVATIFFVSSAGKRPGSQIERFPKTIVGAGEDYPTTNLVAPEISEAEAANVRRFAAQICVEGYLVYTDIWNVEWKVDFAGRYIGGSGPRYRIDNQPREKSA